MLFDALLRRTYAPRDTATITFKGQPILLDPVRGTDQITGLFAAGRYETPLPEMIWAALNRSPGLFLDVGANTGLYALIACAASPKVKVEAFEPYPPVLRTLRQNVRLNRLQRRIAIHPFALGARSETLTLHVPDDAHGMLETSCSLEADFKPAASTAPVQVKRLDDLPQQWLPKVIKVDIEGHEPQFLDGARETISRCRPLLFVEILPNPGREARIGAFKDSLGYVDYRLRPEVAIRSEAVAFDSEAWNHALVPAEAEADFIALCSACGLRVEQA